ncbi:MAG: hypothetical protein OXE93_01600 [bacterium]|nr:hypothetical protein [bacterium]MCY4256831.1 hypothetical protein [bacterium]
MFWSRIRISNSDNTGSSHSTGPKASRTNTTESNSAGAVSQWLLARWQAWREARAERDVLASYRADYGTNARLRWWQRLRAGFGLLVMVSVLGLGLSLLVGVFFVAMTILLETIV